MEKGIFIDDNLYLEFVFSSRKYTAVEAKAYYASIARKIPSLYQLIRLQHAIERVNVSLGAIALRKLPAKIIDNFWSPETCTDALPSEKRSCLVIGHHQNYVDQDYQIIDSHYLLFQHTSLYRIEAQDFTMLSYQLFLHWNVLDFFTVEDKGVTYYFYRGSDLKMIYLGQDLNFELTTDDIFHMDKIYYEVVDGRLVKFLECRYPHKICKIDGVLTHIDYGYYDVEQRYQSDDTYNYYQKDDAGYYKKSGYELIEH